MRTLTRKRTISLLVLAGLALVAAGAMAYYATTGISSASAQAGSINPPSSVSTQQAGSNVTISWGAATLDSGAPVRGYTVTRSDGVVVCGGTSLVTGLSCSDANAPSGTYTYTVSSIYGGFSATAASSLTTILTPPSFTSVPPDPSASTSPTVGFSGGAGSGYQCQLDSGSFASCASPRALGTLSTGSHTFSVRAISGSSYGPSSSYTWHVDTAAPSITGKPANPSNNAAPSFTFTHSESAYTFKCQLDGGGFSSCATPQAYSSLTDGSHTFSVEALDASGVSTAVASYTWKLDTVPPTGQVSLSAASQSTASSGYIYWGNYGNGTIGRANADGTGVNQSFITGAASPLQVAVDGTHIYWSNYSNGTIGRANLDGTGVNESFINTGAGNYAIRGIAVDGSHIYWTNFNAGTIGRANLDGSGSNSSFITGAREPWELAVDGSHIYWTNYSGASVGRANLDGTGANETFIPTTSGPVGVAVDGSHVYWGGNGGYAVGRANLDGTGINQTFVATGTFTYAVAVDSVHLYWSTSNQLGRANLDGSGIASSFISGASNPYGIAASASGSAISANALLSGSTLYYKGNTAGSFSLSDAVSDSGSGPASATFPGIATTGWTHSAETVATGSGTAPTVTYGSSAFNWTAQPGNPSGYAVTSRDAAGNSSSSPLTFVNDSSGPTGGALSVDGVAASNSGSIAVTPNTGFVINSRSDYTEAQSASQSGLKSSVLTVQSETLSNGTCGSLGSGGPFMSGTTIAATTQPTGIAAGYCYVYTLTGTDNVGNTATVAVTVKVDTTAPSISSQPSNPSAATAPSFSFSDADSSYGLQCQLDGGGFSSCASPKAYSGLADGSHTFQVEAVGADGTATSPASYTWTIDTTSPAITSKPASLSNNPSPAFSFSDSQSSYTIQCKVDSGAYGACPASAPAGSGAYFPMDSASVMTDTVGGHTGAMSGATLTTPSAVSGDPGAVTFPSSGTGYTEPYVPANAFTLETWVKTTALGSSGYHNPWYLGQSLINGEVGGVTSDYGLTLDDGQAAFGVGSPDTTIWSPSNINDGQWHLLDATWSSADGAMALYVDGKLVASGSASTAPRTASANQGFLYGGSWQYNQANSVGPLALDEIAISPTRESATQISARYSSGTAQTFTGLADGSHTLQVQAASADGAVTKSTSYTWTIDTAPPSQVFSLAAGAQNAAVSGSTVYYRGSTSGSFALIDTETASPATPASAYFSGVLSGGWTHAAETVSTPSGGPYTSSQYSWSANPGNPTQAYVRGTDSLGNAGNAPLTFVNDMTPPSAGALSVNGVAASPTGSSSLTDSSAFTVGARTDYTEAQSASQSGLKSSTLTVQSESTTGSVPGAGSCGAPGSGGPFTSATTVTGTTQPAGILAGYCYLYTLTGVDNVGNTVSITTTVQVSPKLLVQADSIGQASGSSITSWSDSSPFHNDLTAGATPPTLQTGVWNGHAVAVFGGSAANLLAAQNMAGGNTPYDIFLVAMPTGFGGFIGWGNPGNTGHEVVLRTNNGDGTGLDTYWWWLDDYQGGAPVSKTAPNVIESFWNGTTRGMSLNGNQISNFAQDPSAKNTDPTPLRLGSSSTTLLGVVEPFNGDIAAAVVYEGVLSSADRAAITNYLKATYGVS